MSGKHQKLYKPAITCDYQQYKAILDTLLFKPLMDLQTTILCILIPMYFKKSSQKYIYQFSSMLDMEQKLLSKTLETPNQTTKQPKTVTVLLSG